MSVVKAKYFDVFRGAMLGCYYNAAVVRATTALATVLLTALVATGAKASPETVLYRFAGNEDGDFPQGGLVMDAQGNLYGTTPGGGGAACFGQGCGTVFELSPPAAGGSAWKETILYRFTGAADGSNPQSGLILDAEGNLYGTAFQGGSNQSGTVFKLSPPPPGQTAWTETTLHTFAQNGIDGALPFGRLVRDKHGKLYGVTNSGGTFFDGTVFELSPPKGKSTVWGEVVLYSFTNGRDGGIPNGALTLDAAGNLYGTTAAGGRSHDGTVFRLTPPLPGMASSTSSTETVLHSFSFGTDGRVPVAGVLRDALGNLFGTTRQGGKSDCNRFGCGTVFELNPPAPGGSVWKEKILHNFADVGDGQDPFLAGMTEDAAGNLFGTTGIGGVLGWGTVYTLSRKPGSAVWNETILYSFTGGADGGIPSEDALIADPQGNLYGTTRFGGRPGCGFGQGCGVVFKVKP